MARSRQQAGPPQGQAAEEGHVIELRGLRKSFDQAVINGISLDIDSGQVFGLIGPSGCGKTTLVRLMAGTLKPTSGTVRVLGTDPTRFTSRERERIGYMPQGFFLYPMLTAMENAHFVGGLYGVGWLKRRRRIRELFQFLELWDARGRLASDLSGGMQRRLELACALIHGPELVFVDEPTAGLDPVLRSRIWEYLHGLRDQGMTVIVTTQYIGEASLCDRVAILDRGRVIAVGSPGELRQRALLDAVVEVRAGRFTPDDTEALRELESVRDVEWLEPGLLRLRATDVGAATLEVARTLEARGRHVDSVRPYVPSFDEVFMKLVSDRD